MRITDFINKKIAFTLAEMMVILTVMSVVMAATMPIITAPDSANLAGGSEKDSYWEKGTASKTVSTPNFVAVGMAPDVNTPSTGTAGLFINNKADEESPSQILFTVSPDGKKVYNAGRLYLGYMDNYNIALGANALMDTKLSMPGAVYNDYKSVAIGDWAMRRGSTQGRVGSVAIGSMASYSNAPNDTVAIGYGALSSQGTGITSNSVGIGYLAGHMNSGTINRSTYVGYLAGYNTFINHTSENNTHIGYQAGALSDGRDNVNVGYLAGFYSNDSFSGSNKNKNPSSFSVNIGYNAGAMPSDITYNSSWYDSYSNNHVAIGEQALFAPYASVNEVVAIGAFAAYNSKAKIKGSVFIGSYAGYNLLKYPQGDIVSIGTVSSYKSANSRVAIGFYASAIPQDISNETSDGNIIASTDKNFNEVAIGSNVGRSTSFGNVGIAYGNIMIGNNSGNGRNGAQFRNSICIGTKSCKSGAADSSAMKATNGIFIGKHSAISATKDSVFSIIAYEWPDNGIGDISYSARNVIKTDSGSYINGQMIIAPAKSSESSSFAGSRIIFDATNLYGPATAPTSLSDRTLKKDIKPLEYSLKDLKDINVYEYNYTDEPNVRRIGVIAQDLLKIMPQAVDTSKKDSYSINPDWLFYAVLNAVKELDKTVESCKSSLIAYAKEYQTLSTKMNSLEKEQKQLERERKSLEKQIKKAYKKADKMEKSA